MGHSRQFQVCQVCYAIYLSLHRNETHVRPRLYQPSTRSRYIYYWLGNSLVIITYQELMWPGMVEPEYVFQGRDPSRRKERLSPHRGLLSEGDIILRRATNLQAKAQQGYVQDRAGTGKQSRETRL